MKITRTTTPIGLLCLAGLIAAAAVAQTTVTIPAQTVMARIPAQTVTIPTTSPPVTPPPVTPPPAGVSWIYTDGNLVWFGHDMSYGDYLINYKDTSGKPPGGRYDISLTGTQGGWQPGSPDLNFDTTGYNFFIISLKPTQPGNSWIAGAESSASGGDTVIPGGLNPNVGDFCDKPLTVNQWSACKIPLHGSGFNIPVGQKLRKIMLQQQAPAVGANRWYVTNVGFTP
jgi:hypothetical protein